MLNYNNKLFLKLNFLMYNLSHLLRIMLSTQSNKHQLLLIHDGSSIMS